MRPIDADALINEIKKETEKAIEQDDKVGSFWLGYIAGLVIKQPTIQPEKEQLYCEGTTKDAISRQSVKYLDLFTKTYCRDESATDDLLFRCSDCEFELRPSGKCLVKCMARKLCPDYKDFGSMGDL